MSEDRIAGPSRLCIGFLALVQLVLIKKKNKFSSYIRKFRVEQLQSYIYEEGLPNYEEMRKYLTIYEEAVSHI